MLQSYMTMVECDDRRQLLQVLYCFNDTSTSVNTWNVMQNQRHTWTWRNVVIMELHDQHPVNIPACSDDTVSGDSVVRQGSEI